MRLGYDLRIHRYPPGRTTVYADVIMRSMAQLRQDSWEVVGVHGWPRIARRSPVPAPVRQGANLALDLGWVTVGGGAEAVARRFDAWFAPAVPLAATVPKPSVVIIHGLEYILLPELYDPGFARVARMLVRIAARRADRIAVPSEHVRRTLVERLGVPSTKIATIRWGLDHLPPADAGRIHPRPYGLCVGTTHRLWNMGVLLDAWKAGAAGDLDLVISGPSGSDEPDLRRRAAELGLDQRVRFTGHLATSELMALMRDAELFVYPALSDDRGLAPLESMLYGVPTAVADRGALPEITEGAAVLFDPEDGDAVIDVVRRLREDDALRARLRHDGPLVSGGLRWADTARGLWDEVDRAVAG